MSGFALPESEDIEIGSVIGDSYRLERFVGKGGTASVYRATDLIAKRTVALKFLNKNLLSQTQSIRRFLQEAQTSARLNHDRIARFYSFGTHNDTQPYLVMEFVEGRTLHDYLSERGKLSVAETRSLLIKICDALAYAHEKNVVHRDIKPSNIVLIGNEPDIKIVDFGIAQMLANSLDEDSNPMERLTRTGELIGTPFYMSPEQCQGKVLDKRSDIYAAGCICYEMLTGRPPFVSDSAIDVLVQHVTGAVPSMKDVPVSWRHIILKALDVDPQKRYQTARDLSDAAREAGSGASLISTASSLFVRGPKSGAGRRGKGLALGFAVVLIGGVIGFFAVPHQSWDYILAVLPPNKVPPMLVFDNWADLDMAGQRAFDSGSYAAAEEFYRMALCKAALKGDHQQSVTSLLELLMLSKATENQNLTVWTQKHIRYQPTQAEEDRKEADQFASALDKVAHAETSKEIDSLSKPLLEQAVNIYKYDSQTNSIKLLSSAVERLKDLGERADSARLAFEVSLQYCKWNLTNPTSAGETENLVHRAIANKKVLENPFLCLALAELEASLPSPDQARCARLAEGAMRSPDRYDVAQAKTLQARIAWMSGNKTEAKITAKEALGIVESAPLPRLFSNTSTILLNLGAWESQSNQPDAGLPLLVRAKAIHDSGYVTGNEDTIARDLAEIYASLGRFDDAEKLLKSLRSSTDPAINQAQSLAEIGLLYCMHSRYDRAEACLKDAIKLYQQNNFKDRPNGPFITAMKNLAMLYTKTGRSKEAKHWNDIVQVGRGDAMHRPY